MHPFEQGKSLKEFTTLCVGGAARYFLEVTSIEELQQALQYCNRYQIPFFILGKGSNILFDDRGFNGLVILNKICFFEQNKGEVHVGAGYSFSLLGTQTARKGWHGLEFASGIPGSVGGAVYMNAGANGEETKDVLIEASFLSEEGELNYFSREQLEFSYRSSSFQKKRGAIVSAKFLLQTFEGARQKQLQLIAYRARTQPYSEKSAGCTFCNPLTISAGSLIESCGLKGFEIGDAQVSTLHANFVLNKKNATAKQILQLITHIQETVLEKKGIKLEMEIRYIPYEPNVFTL